jgi:hypothetical protein
MIEEFFLYIVDHVFQVAFDVFSAVLVDEVFDAYYGAYTV